MDQGPTSWPWVPLELCPLETVTAEARDGETATAVLRTPPGPGPFPLVVFLHGGLNRAPLARLENNASNIPAMTRFLAGGYATAACTFRSRRANPQTPTALWDCIALVDKLRKRPEIDARDVFVIGASGGGSLALELAGEADLAAVVAKEPASILFMAIWGKDNFEKRQEVMDEPGKHVTAEALAHTREKIARIHCPVLIVQGDVHPINNVNREFLIPEMTRAGKAPEVRTFPGEPHEFFYPGRRGSDQAAWEAFKECRAFFERHARRPAKPLDEAQIEYTKTRPRRPPREAGDGQQAPSPADG